jgi:PAS domain S-box-containing protein
MSESLVQPARASTPLVLDAAEAKLAASLDAVTEPVLITRADLNPPGPTIIAVSRAFCALTGYTRTELLGRSPRLFQGPLTERAVLDRLRTNCERGDDFVGDTVNYRKDGSTYLLEWAIRPLRNGEGRVTHFISVQRDVTATRRFARQWLEADARARATLEAVTGQMVVIAEAILVLERTKRSFRSHELGLLRDRLNQAARQLQAFASGTTPPLVRKQNSSSRR